MSTTTFDILAVLQEIKRLVDRTRAANVGDKTIRLWLLLRPDVYEAAVLRAIESKGTDWDSTSVMELAGVPVISEPRVKGRFSLLVGRDQ